MTYTYKKMIRPIVATPGMQDHDGTADLDFHHGGSVDGRYLNARGRQGAIRLTRV